MPGALMYPRSPFLECLFVRDLSLICVRSKGRIRVLVPSNGILCARACDCRPQYVCAGIGTRRIHVQSLVTHDNQVCAKSRRRFPENARAIPSSSFVCLRPKCVRREGSKIEVVGNLTSQFAARFPDTDKRMIDISRIRT